MKIFVVLLLVFMISSAQAQTCKKETIENVEKVFNYLKKTKTSFLINKNINISNLCKKKFQKSSISELKVKHQSQIQLNKLLVLEDYDDFFNDDLYIYFIIQVGKISKVHVTQIYRNVDEGDSFFFLPIDRELLNIDSGISRNYIIDYGIVESDGEDLTQLVKISSEVIQLFSYALKKPVGEVVRKLKHEIKLFLATLASLKRDTRLSLDSIRFKAVQHSKIEQFNRHHKGEKNFSEYEYLVNFRVLE